jgi:hypothetical protein
MARYRDFGATNEDDTCLWCGTLFKPETEYINLGLLSICCDAETEVYKEPFMATERRSPQSHHSCTACGKRPCGARTKTEDRPTGRRRGYSGSTHFCTLRCGYLFGENLAAQGKRLVAKNG